MKKSIKIFLAIFSVLLLGSSQTFASNEEAKLNVDFKNSLETKIEKIDIHGLKENMLKEFLNQEKALKTIKTKYLKILENIQKEYNLQELSENNWKKYYDYIKSSSINEEERFLLLSFFDIFENKYKNNEIKKILEDKNKDEKEKNRIVAENLPYNSKFSKNYFKKIQEKQEKSLYSSFNINNAVKYAIKYAINANTNDYDNFSGDCTNFVSQILEAGGINQDVYNSEYQGWWHKDNWYGHTHSVSWLRSDTFVRYMGVVDSTTDHFYFSTLLSKGNIIAKDNTNDGDWNHVGFVTKTHNYVGNYGYFDYKVAQHSSNYHAWTSSSTNGWEINYNGGNNTTPRYGKIRHN